MKTLSGAEYKIIRLCPKDMVPGTKFGYGGSGLEDCLARFKNLGLGYKHLSSGVEHIWDKGSHNELLPTHPLEGMCLDGVER